jgi:hypothetical protein
MAVNVGDKAAHSISCRKGLSEKAPSKGFEKRRHGFDFPNFCRMEWEWDDRALEPVRGREWA